VTLSPEILRQNPQLAALETLLQATENAIIAVIAAHPNLEHRRDGVPLLPIDSLADHLVEHAQVMLDSLDRYRILLRDLERLRRGTLLEDDLIF